MTNSNRSGGAVAGGSILDDSLLDGIDDTLAALTDSYLEWVKADLSGLRRLLEELLGTPAAERAPVLHRMFIAAHDIKGQGGSFGYPLMTAAAASLCRLVETGPPGGPDPVNGIEHHLDLLERIIAKRLAGDGGEDGQALLASLSGK